MARCRCSARDVMAFRDEDGDWTCSSCGRLLRPAEALLRQIQPAGERALAGD
jgi:hypothetical protein